MSPNQSKISTEQLTDQSIEAMKLALEQLVAAKLHLCAMGYKQYSEFLKVYATVQPDEFILVSQAYPIRLIEHIEKTLAIIVSGMPGK